MRYLIDTHAYIWYVEDNKKLSKTALNIIDSPENILYFSVASIWEITIKASLKKLNLKQSISDIFEELEKLNIALLNFTKNDFEILYQLDFFHQDPFDRMLISQAISQNLILISKDSAFEKYQIKRTW
jgi:PIN domain nuclease of toxin-antitoxin system